jgi:hypothetical protein
MWFAQLWFDEVHITLQQTRGHAARFPEQYDSTSSGRIGRFGLSDTTRGLPEYELALGVRGSRWHERLLIKTYASELGVLCYYETL